ncbi:MAG: LysM peptidoglycan-binding domain-containing protein [Candidatus Methylacidiphilales bacterium]|nr:LysM peptidoglycan-binding domain-containing protein [Candidatus Methylacidiphilales bacterium]
MNENQNPKPAPMGGSKLSTIFLVVLGLHIVLIVAFSAYHLLKGDSSSEKPVEEVSSTTEKSPNADEPAWAATEEHPTVETQQAGTAPSPSPAEAEPVPAEAAPLPMPASNDPIWTRVPSTTERPAIANPAPNPAPVVASEKPANVQTVDSNKTYTVAKGDSLARISRNYGVSVADLRSVNGMTNDTIRIGQVIRIPAGRTVAASAAPALPPQAAPVVRRAEVVGGSYTVGKGDTLWKIARKFNVNPQQLANSNGITDPSKLKVGMVLRLPGGVEKQDLAQPPSRPEPAPVNTDMAMVPKN